jgi:2-oxo-3-hexenedioate decarboxylase/2-keto-4-pentenoate hydratase
MAEAARIAAAADILAAARREGRVIDGFPPDAAPRDLAEAIAIQEALARRAAAATLGWKVGATAREVQAKIGLAHPFFGRIFAGTVHADGAALPAGSGHNILEAEFAVRLARAVPGGGHTAETVAERVGAVHIAIEINRPSFRAPFAMRGLDVIADNGSNAGLVLGAPIDDWRNRDLAAQAVVFRLNGQERARGAGAAVMGQPFASLAWLANERARLGAPLAAGDLVATGSLMGFVAAKVGDTAEAEFPGIGTVAVSLV